MVPAGAAAQTEIKAKRALPLFALVFALSAVLTPAAEGAGSITGHGISVESIQLMP
jgi:hypothetical protein